MKLFPYIKPVLFTLPEETAHHLAMGVLKRGWIRPEENYAPESLRQNLWNMQFANVVGLAAGFDKHAEAIPALLSQGFGFIECGTVTPLPQPGNPKPRLFRLEQDEAIINRFGFNSHGADAFEQSFLRTPHKGIVGINIGKNKTSDDAVSDYLVLLRRFYALGNYITINISSPNTPNLRDLQQKEQLDALLKPLSHARDELVVSHALRNPLLLKISPDVNESELEAVIEKTLEYKLDGLIISNTTLSRNGLSDTSRASEQGGLSGKPLFAKSTQVLAKAYQLTEGKLPLVGVGGISSGADAYAKIKAGASLVQVYSALIYHGLGLVTEIKHELATLLERDGFKSVKDAVGVEARR